VESIFEKKDKLINWLVLQIRNCLRQIYSYLSTKNGKTSVADPDPGSDAFLTS
jgi:hypothetical protein